MERVFRSCLDRMLRSCFKALFCKINDCEVAES